MASTAPTTTQQSTATGGSRTYLFKSYKEFADQASLRQVVPPPAMLRISSSGGASSVSSMSIGTMISLETRHTLMQQHQQKQQKAKQKLQQPSPPPTPLQSRQHLSTRAHHQHSCSQPASSHYQDIVAVNTHISTMPIQSITQKSWHDYSCLSSANVSTNSSGLPPPNGKLFPRPMLGTVAGSNRIAEECHVSASSICWSNIRASLSTSTALVTKETSTNTTNSSAVPPLEYKSSDEGAFEKLAYKSLSYRKRCIQMDATVQERTSSGLVKDSSLHESLRRLAVCDGDVGGGDEDNESKIDQDTLPDAFSWLSTSTLTMSTCPKSASAWTATSSLTTSTAAGCSTRSGLSSLTDSFASPKRGALLRKSTPTATSNSSLKSPTRCTSRNHSALSQCRKTKRDLLDVQDPSPEVSRRLQHPSMRNHDFSQRQLRPATRASNASQRRLVDGPGEKVATHVGAKSSSLSAERHLQDFQHLLSISNSRCSKAEGPHSTIAEESSSVGTSSAHSGRKSLSLSTKRHDQSFQKMVSALPRSLGGGRSKKNGIVDVGSRTWTNSTANTTASSIGDLDGSLSSNEQYWNSMRGSATSRDSHTGTNISNNWNNNRIDLNLNDATSHHSRSNSNVALVHPSRRSTVAPLPDDIPRNSDLDNLLQDPDAIERQQAIWDSIREEQQQKEAMDLKNKKNRYSSASSNHFCNDGSSETVANSSAQFRRDHYPSAMDPCDHSVPVNCQTVVGMETFRDLGENLPQASMGRILASPKRNKKLSHSMKPGGRPCPLENEFGWKVSSAAFEHFLRSNQLA